MRELLYMLAFSLTANASQPFYDRVHDSKVFGEQRKYRIFLPAGYESQNKQYPVIYYFHGHSDRYTLEKYDNGLDTVPKIAAFVASHEVIVVAADGYVARDYTGFYGGTPYDVRREGGDFDYGKYFLELIRHIDANYRTLSSRRYRATSGLSMGGFMSLYLSACYPDRVGSASSFNPGPEFYVGEKDARSLWRPKDHVLNHEHSMIRLIRASGDYISQYHEETRTAYAIRPTVDFEYRQDEYHRHWATSIAETFEFHMRAFANAALDTTPLEWNYTTAHRESEVWDYRVKANSAGPSLLSLRHVSQGGLGIYTRRWAPDGPAATCTAIEVTTAPIYHSGSNYQITDYNVATGKTNRREAVADSEGRLYLRADCKGHELGLAGPGTGSQSLVLLPVTAKDVLRITSGVSTNLPVRVFNPRNSPAENVRAELTSDYPTVSIVSGKSQPARIGPGEAADLSSGLAAESTAGEGDFARARLELKLSADGMKEITQSIDVLIAPDHMPAAAEVAVLDGRTHTFPVFRQKGNQGGGATVQRTVSEGSGNGNGLLEKGEQATIWVKLNQGLDPFDKNNWCRAKVYTDSPWLTEVADIQEGKQLEWTSAQSRTSLVELSSNLPSGSEIPVVLDCESWSFHFTPDERFGKEPLYQAFQLHKHYLFSWKWKPNDR
jgi:predicted alpha/beta superfamily hydrolase